MSKTNTPSPKTDSLTIEHHSKKGKFTISLKKLPSSHSERKKNKSLYLLDARINGIRTRKYFKNGEIEIARQAYEKLISQQDELSTKESVILTNDQHLKEAAESVLLLKPHGKTIKDAVAHYIAFLESEAQRDKTPISKVADLLMTHLETTPKKGGGMRSKEYLKGINRHYREFEAHFKDSPITQPKAEQIRTWINSLDKSDTTKDNLRTSLCTLYNFAVKHSILDLKDNPMTLVNEYERAESKGYFKPEQVRHLLSHCDQDIRPIIALLFFTGIRPCAKNGELSRLKWEDFNFEENTLCLQGSIRTKKGKSKKTRDIAIQPNLQEWLKPYEFKTGLVIESYAVFRRKFEKAKKSAGLYAEDWPHDATRNSFCTYRYKQDGMNKYAVMSESGHTVELTFEQHYRTAESKKNATAYFNITPIEVEKVITMKKAV